ncbi:MAG: nuclear transport factor 2 family protein [Bacteroidetes bacterium]|nr:nuclear transport factor 2 family protein [Bacteroidota bacterium]MBL7105684.1 nuclear transport factor 2 family protein [Bacteroidales bacterium]
MKKIIVIILLSVIVVSCNNLDKQSKASFDPEQEMENIALVLEKYVIANERQEIELVKEIWAPDTDIVVIGTNSDEKLIGWDQIKDALQRQFNTFEETYISVRDQVIEINETGNTAWFSEILNYNYIYQDEARQYEGLRFTGVLEKRNGDWYIVQSHMSIPGSPD